MQDLGELWTEKIRSSAFHGACEPQSARGWNPPSVKVMSVAML